MIEKTDHILITGGSGFLGQHLIKKLKDQGYDKITSLGSKQLDLRVKQEVDVVFRMLKPNVVIHAAAVCGGIFANQVAPARFLEDNTRINLNVVEACSMLKTTDCNFKKLVGIGTVCSYPKFAPTPFKEEDLWNGMPEETNMPYGLSKRLLLAHIQAANQQYGLPGIFLIPVNLYGQGDCFDEKRSHVVPALIKRIYDLKTNTKEGHKVPDLVCWGTGNASREFFHVDDAARGIILAMEKYDKIHPINLGNGKEVSIKKLVELLVKLMNFNGHIVWDETKPDGQPRRCLDVSRAKKEFNFEAQVLLEDGLKETIKWFEENYYARTSL